jgi:probable rRNA maturation factor
MPSEKRSKSIVRLEIVTSTNPKRDAPPQISVRNLQRVVPVNVRNLEDGAVKALDSCLRVPKNKPTALSRVTEVTVVLVSDRRMASLHRQFLNVPGPTDVLTFEHGEIVVSAETALRNARTYGNSLARELLLYVVHGLLHLQGWDDRTQADRRKMEITQEKIIAPLT